MSEPGPPPAKPGLLSTLAAYWNGREGMLARGGLVLLLAIAGARYYAGVVGAIYPVKDWLFWQIGTLWAWGALLSLACVSAGHLVLARALRVKDLPTLETVVTSAAVGLLVFVLGMYAGGAVHQFNGTFAVLLPIAMVAAGARDLWAFARERKEKYESNEAPRTAGASAIAAAAAVSGIVGATFVYLEALTPDAINFDASWSHLPIAADYARAGKLIAFDADYTRNYPHLASIVHTWAFIVPKGPLVEPALRWMLCLHLEFFFFLWTLAGIAAMTRWLLDDDRVRGTWAAFFLFPAIFVYDMNLGGAADHYLAFFAPPLFLAAMRAMRRFEPRLCVLAGALAAGPLLTKYQGIYLLFGVFAIVGGRFLLLAAKRLLARIRREEAADLPSWRELGQAPLLVAAALAVVSSPHFIKNWVFYSNPFYPFAQDVFKHSHPTTHNAAFLFEWLFKDYHWRPHGTFKENVYEALKLLLTFSFEPHYSFTKDVPNTGSLFTLTIPLALLVRKKGRLWLGIGASLGAVFAWAMIFRVDRHLQTFLPLLAATTGAVIVRAWDLGWIARAGVAPLVLLQVIWGGDAMFYSGHRRLQSAVDLIRGGYEGKRAERYRFRSEFVALKNALPADAKIVLHNYRPNLGIDRDILLDWPGQQARVFYEGLGGPRALYDYWRSLGVTHLLHVPSHRPTQTKQDDILFSDFVLRYGQGRKRFGALELVTLPSAPPPPDHPYKVLSIGLWGYRDGLYPVEAMKTYEGVPQEHRERFPRPEKPMPSDPAEQRRLADEADAVALAVRAKPDASLKAHVEAQFMVAASYGRSFTIYVRKGSVTRVDTAPMQAPASTPPHEEEPGGPER